MMAGQRAYHLLTSCVLDPESQIVTLLNHLLNQTPPSFSFQIFKTEGRHTPLEVNPTNNNTSLNLWHQLNPTKAQKNVVDNILQTRHKTIDIVTQSNTSILELLSPVPYYSIQTVIGVGRDLLLRVVPPLMKKDNSYQKI